MNLANKLTLLRISIVPFLIVFMYLDNLWTRIIALLLFTIAAVTDVYDGMVARQQKTVTTLGIFLDPLADKLLISAAMISFVGSKRAAHTGLDGHSYHIQRIHYYGAALHGRDKEYRYTSHEIRKIQNHFANSRYNHFNGRADT